MNQPLQLPAPHVGATQDIWEAINVDLQQIVDDVSCWEGANAERMGTQLEAAVKRLNAAVGHEREGYEAAIASSFQIEALRERCEKLELVLADKLNASTLLTGMNIRNGGVELEIEGGAASLFAESLARQYKDSGATNYMEVSFTSHECVPGERFIVTAQRVTGQTPHQFRVQAEAERDSMTEQVTRSYNAFVELQKERDAWKLEAESQYGLLRLARAGADPSEADYPTSGALDAYVRGKYNIGVKS